uniref:G-protein coupled receptors family 3 profile domain-containing protein n=1 Tax=Cavia porcellus TaxID=10141 RepID=H0W0Z0_CAVPO
YQYVLAFYFAIEEINKDSQLLPNVTLGFHVYNAIASDHFIALPNYNCQTHRKFAAVIAGTSAAFSAETGTILELYKFPQVTYGPFDPILNDKHQYPSVYQMALNDRTLVHAMISLLLHFGWTWVAIFVSNDVKGEHFLGDLKAEILKKGICVALTEKLPVTKIIKIRVSSANVHILYGEVASLINVDIAAEFFLTTGKVWIMTAKWDIVVYETDHMLHSFHGSFSFSPHKGEVPGFRQFLQTIKPSQYPEDFFFICPPNTSLEFMPGNIDLMTLSDSSYFIYNAVYALAHVLHKVLLEKAEFGSSEDAEEPGLLPWQLHPHLKKMEFTNSAGYSKSLDEERQHVAQYDIQNTLNFPGGLRVLVNVGKFFFKRPHGQSLVINDELIEWPVGFTETPQSVCSQSCGPGFSKIPQEGRPVCCFTCIFCPERHISNQTDAEQCTQCPKHEYSNRNRDHCLPKILDFLSFEDPLGMALTQIALSFSLITAVILAIFVKHRDTPIVKANNRTLSYTLLISLLLCFLCSLLFIGRPNTGTCILQQMTFGLVFTVAVSSVLAKTITVVLAFKVTGPGRRMRHLLVSGAPNYIIPICTLIQLTICGFWMGTNPPYIDTDAHSEHGHIIIVCNKGSLTAFYCVLGYLGSLALLSFTVAFLAKNLPDTFNEAKFLTFSMLVFCSVWVTFLPVYHSSKGKVMVAMEVFSILASSAGLLGCIFLPKCYVILIRSENNTLTGLKSRKNVRGNRYSKNINCL